MFCPNCGKEDGDQQRFCRACGLGLQTISEALAGERSAPTTGESSEPLVKRASKRWNNPLVYAAFLFLFGLVIILVGKKAFGEQLVADMGTALAFLGMVLFGYAGVQRLGTSRAAAPQPAALPEAKSTKELPPALPPGEPQSVTEHTTRNFEPVYSKRKPE